MKPFRIFIFFATVAAWLFFLALIFPRQGITVAPGMTLRFMDHTRLLERDTIAGNRVVDRLVATSTVTEDPEEGFDPGEGSVPKEGFALEEGMHGEGRPGGAAPGEAVRQGESPLLLAVDPANTDSLKQSVYRIAFPAGGERLLDPFFKKLSGLKDGSLARTRILHYGDSQIENDRMTALIRYRMQRVFGGSGTGLVQPIPLYSGSMAYEQEEGGEWLRYTFFWKRDSTIQHHAYGVMGAFASVPMPAGEEWPWLRYTFNTRRRTGHFDRVRVFLHSYADSASMVFVVNDTITDTIRPIAGGFSVADFRHTGDISRVGLHLCLPQGGRMYGISFESYRGLQVDNIAMRGGSGLIFTKMNREHQLRMLELLSPGLLILQFGGNVVPYIDAGFYHRAFRRELTFLRDLCPDVPVIVIGPSDMSLKENGRFITYPGVEPVRDALKRAALESGCAFWDLYEAMGGYNSMPSFVHAAPPLASTDYVHFTPLGVNLVAEMFYNALMLEYSQPQTKRSSR